MDIPEAAPVRQVDEVQLQGTGAVTRAIQENSQETISVKNFGAIGNGVNDDTAAIQKAINYCTTTDITGRAYPLYIPKGTYIISSAIIIPSSYGFSILGDGRENSRIIQKTNGATILYFSQTGVIYGPRNFVIDGISFEYTNQQTSANNSKALDCIGQNWVFRNCAIVNGYRGLYNLVNNGGRNGAWGLSIQNCVFSNMSGASIIYDWQSGKGYTDGGFPNNSIRDIYIYGDSAPTEAALILHNWNSCTLNNIELNEWNQQILNASQCSGHIGSIRLENIAGQCQFDTTKFNAFYALVNCPDCVLDISHFEVEAEIGTSNGTLYLFSSTGTQSTTFVRINHLKLGSSSGTMIPNGGIVVVFAFMTAALAMTPTNLLPSYTQLYTASEDFAFISCFPGKGQQTIVSDANTSIAFNSPEVIIYNTTLTTNRTITLPSLSTNLFNGGQEWIIIRNASIPGDYTLTIQSASASIVATIPSSNVGIIRIRPSHSGWIITGKYVGKSF